MSKLILPDGFEPEKEEEYDKRKVKEFHASGRDCPACKRPSVFITVWEGEDQEPEKIRMYCSSCAHIAEVEKDEEDSHTYLILKAITKFISITGEEIQDILSKSDIPKEALPDEENWEEQALRDSRNISTPSKKKIITSFPPRII